MSISRSPSPVPGGGWSSPGLNINSGRTSPSNVSAGPVAWESAKMRNLSANGYPSFSTQNQGFFTRHMRQISSSLPRFHPTPDMPYAEKEKLGRGRWADRNVPLFGRIRTLFGRMGRKLKLRLLIALVFLICITIFYNSRRWNPRMCRRHPLTLLLALLPYWRRRAGGGEKFVIILAANVGGGVMEWKGAREWAIERDSVRNKKKYTSIWGYDLEIVDMSTKKRYAHEWRESWEKVDFIRSSMRKYPKAEW